MQKFTNPSQILHKFTDTMISRKDNGVTNLVYTTVFTVEVNQHVYMLYIPHLNFDEYTSFLTYVKLNISAEYIFLLWSKDLPNIYDLVNTHIKPLFWSNPSKLVKTLFMFGDIKTEQLVFNGFIIIKTLCDPHLENKSISKFVFAFSETLNLLYGLN